MEEHLLPVSYGQDCGRGFILLLPQAAVLLESDAGSDGFDQLQVSSFKTVRPRAPCGARCAGLAVSTWSAICHWRHPHSRVKVRTLFVHGLMKPSNIISQAIKLKLSSPRQTHSYMSGISHEYKGRNLDVL